MKSDEYRTRFAFFLLSSALVLLIGAIFLIFEGGLYLTEIYIHQYTNIKMSSRDIEMLDTMKRHCGLGSWLIVAFGVVGLVYLFRRGGWARLALASSVCFWTIGTIAIPARQYIYLLMGFWCVFLYTVKPIYSLLWSGIVWIIMANEYFDLPFINIYDRIFAWSVFIVVFHHYGHGFWEHKDSLFFAPKKTGA